MEDEETRTYGKQARRWSINHSSSTILHELFGLLGMEMGVKPALGKEFRVGSFLRDNAVVQHTNPVTALSH